MQKGTKLVSSNRSAYHEYYVEDKLEVGIALTGTEVKSIRKGSVNLKDAYCIFKNGECLVHGMHISPYKEGNIFNPDPLRERRLLLHKSEIRKWGAEVQRSGYTVVPLAVYLKDSLVKLELGLCKGKKLYDKRDVAAKRDATREIERKLKER
jgi:SsrA-binding protein